MGVVDQDWRGMMRGRLSLAGALAVMIWCCQSAHAVDSEAAMNELIRSAKAEGQVEVLLSGQVPLLLKPVMPLFEKKYGIRVNFQTGGGDQNGLRILAERRVGRYTLDVWLGGANTALAQLLPNNALVPINDLLIDPDVTDLSKWYHGRYFYVDAANRYILAFGAQPQQTISFNTNLVKESDINSFHDLLDPKWKGKMVSWNPSVEGAAATSVAMYLHPRIGEEWFVRWAREMQVTVVDDVRQGAEWVALGRFPLGIFGVATQAEKLRSEGFPIQGYIAHPLAEGQTLSSSATNIMVMDRAPHSKAAQLFVNWILTRDTQQAIIKASGTSDSMRIDVDNSVIPAQYRKDPKADYYIAFSDPRYQTQQTEIMARLRQIMIDAGYK
jgi:iron(III) transport system substrate-binding protein